MIYFIRGNRAIWTQLTVVEETTKFVEGFYERTSFMHDVQIKKKEDPFELHNNKLLAIKYIVNHAKIFPI